MIKIVIFATLLLTLLFVSTPTDSDLFWHLRYGQIMLEEGRLPFFDEFSWTFPSYPWANSYWLSDIFIYGGYKFLGILPLTFIFALIGALAFVFLAYFAQEKKRPFLFILIVLLSGSLAIDFVRIRAQAFSILFFSLLLIFLLKNFYRKKVTFFLLPPFFALWANIHSGFILGFIFVGLFLIFEAISCLAKKDRSHLKELTPLFVSFIISIPTTLLNPYGIFLWQTLWGDITSGSMWKDLIAWQPTPFLFKQSILLVSTIIFALFSFRDHFTKIPFSFLASSFIALFLGINSFFFLPVWGLFFCYLVLAYPPQFFNQKNIAKYLSSYIVIAAIFLILATFSNLYASVWSSYHPREVEKRKGYPFDGLLFLQSQKAKNIFNEYSWGGYMIWYAPDLKTFVDGRMPGWKRGERRIFSDYLKIIRGSDKGRRLLEDYGVSWVLIGKNTQLEEKILSGGRWKKVFEDANSVVFRKV